MRIAVVTPVYNGAKFLEAAMEAVQRQTYRPLVHVVLDNASTDATPEIIGRFKGRDVPLLTKRNAEVLPAARNWSEVVRMVPSDIDYFAILCADDLMVPDAIEKMVAVAKSAADVRVVMGEDKINGAPVWTDLPPDSVVFEAAAMLARIFSDGAEVAYHHLMYRTDTRPADGSDFFSSDVVSFDADAGLRTMAQGGRVGVVHEPIFETIAHAGTLTATWTKKVASQHYEFLIWLERFGPAALSRTEYQATLRRRLLWFYRKILFRALSGKAEFARRDLERLKERGHTPDPIDFAMSLLTWPAHVHHYRVARTRAHAPWPASAESIALKAASPVSQVAAEKENA